VYKMGFEKNVGLIIYGVVCGVILIVVVLIVYGFSGLPVGCNKNCLCENKYTKVIAGYKDRGEGTLVPCYLTDCCYDAAKASDICRKNLELYLGRAPTAEEESKYCSDLSRRNPLTLFDCAAVGGNWYGITIKNGTCNNETCVKSCNWNMRCEEDLGENKCCIDCI